MELVYHLGILKEQINFYFGYEYIHQIKLVQAVFQVQMAKELTTEKKLSSQQQLKSAELVANYDQEDEIKKILLKFAEEIAQKY